MTKPETPLPCPFCGDKSWVFENDGVYSVVCNNKAKCRVEVALDHFGPKEKAIAEWNRRAAASGGEREVDDEDLCERCAKVRYTEEMESGRQLCMRCCLIEMDATIMAQEKELNTFGANAVAACERQRLPAIMDDDLSTAYNNGVTDCVAQIKEASRKAGRAIQELAALSSGERCSGCDAPRIGAILAVLQGQVACCPDCSTLTMGERKAIRSCPKVASGERAGEVTPAMVEAAKKAFQACGSPSCEDCSYTEACDKCFTSEIRAALTAALSSRQDGQETP